MQFLAMNFDVAMVYIWEYLSYKHHGYAMPLSTDCTAGQVRCSAAFLTVASKRSLSTSVNLVGEF